MQFIQGPDFPTGGTIFFGRRGIMMLIILVEEELELG